MRCLSAPRTANIEIEVHLAKSARKEPDWKYAIGITQDIKENHPPYLAYERVWKGFEKVIERPDSDDKKDPLRLTQTSLQ